MSEKVTGYLLLISGLIIITISAYIVYETFTGQRSPIPLISAQNISLDLASIVPGQKGSLELFSAKDLNLLSNLTIQYLLMTFFVSLGFKVSQLGIQLLRPINVKLNQKTS